SSSSLSSVASPARYHWHLQTSKCANGMVLVWCQVEEVDVLGTFVVEVGVH
uniref:Uncharacterized protein n=1 Tax=Triticum urartu TaxID=4572 RepID=A0A8R7TTC5_TRIUA